MQWADTSLLDFVEYLLEWSRDYPLYVIALTRPELHERRPAWGAALRNFSSLYVEPLSQQAMEELLDGLVPGLPERLRDQILARAEGVPLYAVETVRMLLDRGLLVNEGAVYRPAGEIEALEVPETLHALIAARLDGLAPEERRLLQDGAVLGKTFSPGALAALSGIAAEELERVAFGSGAQGGARRPVRPALAGARPVRLPPGPRPPCRLRDALQARAQDPAPGRRRLPPRKHSPTRTKWPRCSPPTTLPPPSPHPRPRTPTRSARSHVRCSPAPASAQRRSARPRRANATSSRRLRSPRSLSPGPS